MFIKLIHSLALFSILFLSFSTPTFAAIKGSGCTETINDRTVVTLNCVPVLVQDLIFWALTFAGIIALALIIFSGIKFITSGGDPKQVEGARKTLTFAVAGLILILISFAILIFLARITGVECLTGFPQKGFKACFPE